MAAATVSPLHSKEVSWYTPGPPQLSGGTKLLLKEWSDVSDSDDGIEKHVEAVREQAWAIFQYPCIGGYRFLILGLAAHPLFDQIVALLKSPRSDTITKPQPLFVDLGCCVGQDLRSLAHAGVPSSRLVGVDLESAFVDIGYELFRDQKKLESRFMVGNILSLDASTPGDFEPLIGQVTVLWASAFFHLWGLTEQIELCSKILILLSNTPGVRVLGRHVGSKVAAEKLHTTSRSGLMYRHNPETFTKMWADVLGHVGKVENGIIRSAHRGTWKIRAWFEDDNQNLVQRAQNDDWLNRVTMDTAISDPTDAQIRQQAAAQTTEDDMVRWLVWEVERIE